MQLSKRILIFLVFILSAHCGFTQNATAISLSGNEFSKFTSGEYLKDIDEKFNFYVGVWECRDEKFKYVLSFSIMAHAQIKFPGKFNYFKDLLLVTYKVIDVQTNSVVFDSEQNQNPLQREFKAFGYENMEKIALISIHDSNGGNIAVELHRNQRKVDVIWFQTFKHERTSCGTPKFDRSICPLPTNLSEFIKVN